MTNTKTKTECMIDPKNTLKNMGFRWDKTRPKWSDHSSRVSSSLSCTFLEHSFLFQSVPTLFLHTAGQERGEERGEVTNIFETRKPPPLPSHHQTLLPLPAVAFWHNGFGRMWGVAFQAAMPCQLNGQVKWLKELFYVWPVSVRARPKHVQIFKSKKFSFVENVHFNTKWFYFLSFCRDLW